MRPAQSFIPYQQFWTSISRVGFIAVTLLVTACGDDDIRVYRVPKDAPVQSEQTSAPAPSSTSPTVTWTLPGDWKRIPIERDMRIATFRAGVDDSAPEVSLSAFPGDVGGMLPNINRWRQQIGLEAVDNTALTTLVDTILVDGVTVSVVDMLGSDNRRMLGAVIEPGDGQTWFVKATDAPDKIEKIVASFAEFARSFRLSTSSALQSNPKSPGPPAAGLSDRLSQWSPPPHWRPDPDASPILTAAFIATNSNAGARITVTSLKGTGGGSLANINRWRGQIGLEPVASLSDQPTIDLGGNALIVDLISDDQSSGMVAAILPLAESVWFFKMTGSAAGVSAERTEFDSFVHVVGLGDDPDSRSNTSSDQEAPSSKTPVAPDNREGGR